MSKSKKKKEPIKDWEYYKKLYESTKDNKKHHKTKHRETRQERIKRQVSERDKVFRNQVKSAGKASAYQSRNRSHMTAGEWSCEQMLKDIKKQYHQVDYEFQHVFYTNKDKSKFFIIDFYIKSPFNIAIEIDGGYHNKYDQATYDQWRQEKIQSSGILVIRYRNQDVCLDFDNTKAHLISVIENRLSHSRQQYSLEHPV